MNFDGSCSCIALLLSYCTPLRIALRKELNRIYSDFTQTGVKKTERVGFEPTDGVNRQRFSRPPHSTTLPPLR